MLILTLGLLPAVDLPAADEIDERVSEDQRQAGWRLLFDGRSMDGWRGYHAAPIPDGWRVENGTLHCSGGSGDIITRERFENFELALEWKVAHGGNSGIFYRAELGEKAIYMSAPEMQVLDDTRHRDGGDPLTSAGANYGLHPAPRGVARPAGSWNSARIRVSGGQVEHWLNGQKIVSYVLGSPDWSRRVANSKFSAWPNYGTARDGHIGLQDHGDPVWFRDIRIRVLD
jgi:hypothetical protein